MPGEEDHPRRGFGRHVARAGVFGGQVEPDQPGGLAPRPERLVGGDTQEPRSECALVADRAAVLECRQERLDDDILGLAPVAQDQVGDRLELPSVGGQEVGQRLGSTSPQGLDGHPLILPGAIGRPRSEGRCTTTTFRASDGSERVTIAA